MDFQDEMATYDHCNHCGELNETEFKEKIIKKLLVIMKKFDKKDTGHIKNTDVKQVIQHLRARMSEAEMFQMINDFDLDNSGYIHLS